MRMNKPVLGTIILATLLLAPAAAATWQSTANQMGKLLLDMINFVFNTPGSKFSEALFMYILPAILVYSILFDFIFLMGFFRRRTAQIISVIFALFGARFKIYNNVVELMATFLGTDKTGSGVFIPMLTFLFIMMLIWWVIGHIIWGYKFAHEIQTQQGAMDYLHKIGEHLEAQTKGGSAK